MHSLKVFSTNTTAWIWRIGIFCADRQTDWQTHGHACGWGNYWKVTLQFASVNSLHTWAQFSHTLNTQEESGIKCSTELVESFWYVKSLRFLHEDSECFYEQSFQHLTLAMLFNRCLKFPKWKFSARIPVPGVVFQHPHTGQTSCCFLWLLSQ